MFKNVVDFPPRLKMGDEPGTNCPRCRPRKMFRYEQTPARWCGLFESEFPDGAKDLNAEVR